MGSTVDQWLHFWDVPRRCFSIFSDSDRWGDDGISVVGNRKYVFITCCFILLTMHFLSFYFMPCRECIPGWSCIWRHRHLRRGLRICFRSGDVPDDGFCGSRGNLYRKLSSSCKNAGVSHEIIPVRKTGAGDRSDSWIFVFICSGIACFFHFSRENVINHRLTGQRKMFIIVPTR